MIECTHLTRTFPTSHGGVAGVVDVSFAAAAGDFVVLQGPSGSGKSTLLLALGGMLRPESGTIRIDGIDLYRLGTGERSAFRAARIGFVFQLFHLVPYLTVEQNVLAGLPHGAPAGQAQRALTLLDELGLGTRRKALPGTLSAGERQRTALARALAKQPSLVLADEPTGNLDPANAAIVFRHLETYRANGGTVVVVTHGTDAQPHATRWLRLDAGRLVDGPATTPPISNPIPRKP